MDLVDLPRFFGGCTMDSPWFYRIVHQGAAWSPPGCNNRVAAAVVFLPSSAPRADENDGKMMTQWISIILFSIIFHWKMGCPSFIFFQTHLVKAGGMNWHCFRSTTNLRFHRSIALGNRMVISFFWYVPQMHLLQQVMKKHRGMRVLVALGNIRAFPSLQAPGAFFLFGSHPAAQVDLGKNPLPKQFQLIHLVVSTEDCNHLESSHFNDWKLSMRHPEYSIWNLPEAGWGLTKIFKANQFPSVSISFPCWATEKSLNFSPVAHFVSAWTSAGWWHGSNADSSILGVTRNLNVNHEWTEMHRDRATYLQESSAPNRAQT